MRNSRDQPWDPALRSYPFWCIETICIVFFTIELLLRCATCPSVKMFFTNSLNIIDIIAIVPYFVTIMVEVLALAEESDEIDASGWDGSGEGSAILALEESDDYSTQHYSDKVAFLAVMRIVRLLRIIRLAKLSRHSRNLNALVKECGLNSFQLGYSTGRF